MIPSSSIRAVLRAVSARALGLLLCLACAACSTVGKQVRVEPAPQAEALTPPPEPTEERLPEPVPEPPVPTIGDLIATRAAELVGQTTLRKTTRAVPDDCSGLVRWVYAEVGGVDLMRGGMERGENAVTAIHREAQRRNALRDGEPRPGDLVFFRETYDRNRDGRRNDGLTHIGVVESVAADGTVTFVHRGLRGIARARFNRQFPRVRTDERGEVLNDYLRPSRRQHPTDLAGELFAGFASSEALVESL